jgi:hypothetical protein
MKIVLSRNTKKKGCADEWTATVKGMRPGIGYNRTEAIGSLFSANLRVFGITEREDRDPESSNPVVTWHANPEGEGEQATRAARARPRFFGALTGWRFFGLARHR